MEFQHTDKVKDLLERVTKFMDDHVYEGEKVYADQMTEFRNQGNPWQVPPVLDELKAKAKAEGLWNLFLPDSQWGPGLTNLEYAPLSEQMGRCGIASEVFNCSAPDTGNMEVIDKYGNPEQQEQWLKPLLDGEIRSAFGMTEPNVASSDATNIGSRIEDRGDRYVINGEKWWTSGAGDPRCKIIIFMGVTNPDNPPHQRQSQVLVPMNTEGVTVVRPMHVFGYDDGYTGHPEVRFENVIVPKTNLIGGEGAGFKIAQARLGPGRIHHCMRTIGMSERALELMIKRTLEREAFGKTLSEQGVIQQWIAKSRIKIEEARLLTLKTAWLMDTVGKDQARIEISSIKVSVMDAATYVIDKAIQAHGAMGVSQDTPLAKMAAGARVLRIADGPDEVHLQSIAKREINKHR